MSASASDRTYVGRRITSSETSGHLIDGLDIPEWMDRGLCAQTDPEEFFPEKGGTSRPAKKVCATCEVRDDCLEYALEHNERYGIWGGLSERERRKLNKKAAS